MYSYSYLEGESTTQLETGMSKIIEEGPTCFSKPSSSEKKKKCICYRFYTELYSIIISNMKNNTWASIRELFGSI